MLLNLFSYLLLRGAAREKYQLLTTYSFSYTKHLKILMHALVIKKEAIQIYTRFCPDAGQSHIRMRRVGYFAIFRITRKKRALKEIGA